MSIRRSFVFVSLSLLAPLGAFRIVPHDLAPVPATTIADSLRIFYIGRPAGWEHYALKPRDGGNGMTLTSDYDYVDRGRRNHTQLTINLGGDYALKTFETVRLTDTSRTVTTSVEFNGANATVIRGGKSTDVSIPKIAYAVSSYAPTAQHLALIRYWESHGKPRTIAIVPGDPNTVTIRQRGVDTVGTGAGRVLLTRYAIDGVIWGINYVWLDANGRMAMFATGGGGGLSFKTVRAALLPLRDELMGVATRAQMAELVTIASRTKPMAEGKLALVGATLVDATGAPAVPNATVVVENGRIVAAGPSANTPVPNGTRRIDVTGKTIVPGLWDNHAHLHQIEWIPTYFAAGVTSVRDMGSEWPLLVAMRSAIRSGKVTGPNLFFAGLIDGPGPQGFGEFSAATPDEGRAIVRRYHQMGFEMMKIYLALAPDVTAAICDEAHKQGMPCTGHVPTSMDLHAAIDSGMDQIAHFPVRGDLTTAEGKTQLAHFVAKKTVFDPTASWGEIGGKSAQEPMENIQPVLQRLPAPLLQNRIASLGQSPSDTATSHARLARTLANIRAAHDAGVPIITGTDEGIPGFSIYREMELFVKAGFTPMDALRSATAVAAEAMRVDKDVGTIEKGKRADLLVLDANPLDDISNIRSVRFVMKDGKMFESSALWTAAGFKPDTAQRSSADLDATVTRIMAEQHVVGASVLVAQNGRTLLHKGYGVADIGLDVPTKDETVYHIVGPMLPFTGVAVMQLVERGQLALDDDIAKYVPEFPMQGRRVTVRQLLDHTSGIVDYHYLGDPIEATSRQPKALDEVMALYAGKRWVNEPGAKWDWSISGFQLLVTIVERVSGKSFADYARTNLFEPAGLTHTTYCDDYTLVHGLSHAYRRFENGFVPANENDMAYNADLRICSTVGDFYKLWSALANHTLLRAETFKAMYTAQGAAARMNASDPQAQYGLALTINHEDDHRRYGQHGSLFGYSGSLYEFPNDGLTIVVLSNTEGQNAYAITRALSRQILGLPALPAAPTSAASAAPRALEDVALTPAERRQLDGTFVLAPDRVGSDLHDSYAQYRRTVRVFDENGRLMMQTLGEGPERLFKQKDGTFARRSSPRAAVTIVVENGSVTQLRIASSSLPLSGRRVGPGDPATFHAQLK